MTSRNVLYFTEQEEEFAALLHRFGIGKNISKVLVYLANTRETTSRDIERGTDLRQPEVSMAMTAMIELKWIESREERHQKEGRPVKIYKLALPISEIVDELERGKTAEADKQLEMIKQLREFIAEQ
ncbi:MAG: ArsR family transcriptional regulator [Methanomicrobiales archaeon]|nr:ArsR family transcriptional regulator [Methanomicrobiales archaeon]